MEIKYDDDDVVPGGLALAIMVYGLRSTTRAIFAITELLA